MNSWDDILALVDRAKEGDQEAFDEVFARYSRRLESFIRRQLDVRLGRSIEFEDVVGETYLRAFCSIGQFRGATEGSLVGWLRTIAQRAIQDEGRRLRRSEAAHLAEFLEAGGPSPSQAARRTERFERLQRALESLSEDHRKVVLLARVSPRPWKR